MISRKLTQSLLCTPTYTTLVRDRLPYWIASVRYQLLTFSHLNPSPPTYHQRSRIYADRLTYNGCHGPSVTDASNPKNYTKNDRLQHYETLRMLPDMVCTHHHGVINSNVFNHTVFIFRIP